MRTLTLFLVSILVFLLFFAGCIVQIVSTVPAAAAATAPAAPSTLQMISLAILGVYEVVARVVPSVGNYSIVSWLITALKIVSDKLNNSK